MTYTGLNGIDILTLPGSHAGTVAISTSTRGAGTYGDPLYTDEVWTSYAYDPTLWMPTLTGSSRSGITCTYVDVDTPTRYIGNNGTDDIYGSPVAGNGILSLGRPFLASSVGAGTLTGQEIYSEPIDCRYLPAVIAGDAGYDTALPFPYMDYSDYTLRSPRYLVASNSLSVGQHPMSRRANRQTVDKVSAETWFADSAVWRLTSGVNSGKVSTTAGTGSIHLGFVAAPAAFGSTTGDIFYFPYPYVLLENEAATALQSARLYNNLRTNAVRHIANFNFDPSNYVYQVKGVWGFRTGSTSIFPDDHDLLQQIRPRLRSFASQWPAQVLTATWFDEVVDTDGLVVNIVSLNVKGCGMSIWDDNASTVTTQDLCWPWQLAGLSSYSYSTILNGSTADWFVVQYDALLQTPKLRPHTQSQSYALTTNDLPIPRVAGKDQAARRTRPTRLLNGGCVNYAPGAAAIFKPGYLVTTNLDDSASVPTAQGFSNTSTDGSFATVLCDGNWDFYVFAPRSFSYDPIGNQYYTYPISGVDLRIVERYFDTASGLYKSRTYGSFLPMTLLSSPSGAPLANHDASSGNEVWKLTVSYSDLPSSCRPDSPRMWSYQCRIKYTSSANPRPVYDNPYRSLATAAQYINRKFKPCPYPYSIHAIGASANFTEDVTGKVPTFATASVAPVITVTGAVSGAAVTERIDGTSGLRLFTVALSSSVVLTISDAQRDNWDYEPFTSTETTYIVTNDLGYFVARDKNRSGRAWECGRDLPWGILPNVAFSSPAIAEIPYVPGMRYLWFTVRVRRRFVDLNTCGQVYYTVDKYEKWQYDCDTLVLSRIYTDF